MTNVTGFFSKIKALLLSYPDKDYIDWQIAGLKRSVMESHTSPLLIQNMLYRTEPGVSSVRCCGEELIVSLSTFGRRIHGVALTIESLMEQTVRPNRIILNLDSEFGKPGRIPGSLKLLEKRGLEIRFFRDCGPYMKLLPTLRDFPEATVITVELPFVDWRFAPNDCEPSPLLQPEGVRGVLYPPHSLDERVFDEKLFMSLCPSTDDFWFKTMGLLHGTQVVKCYADDERANPVNSRSDVSCTLHAVNHTLDGYDSQWKALFDHFGLGRYF